ncbi:MAG: serine hydroxymethyltransferase, partial [Desulfobacterales bacterium]|nr:serine hydroxymethyltransferase [Desulfobacterales bacterium]
LRSKDISGDVAEKTLESVGIVVNRNVIPGDPQSPDVTSGIRIGSPGITTRGMGNAEVDQIVKWIDTALVNGDKPHVLENVTEEVAGLCKQFPVYGD